ncbi:MAG: hypothetical protein E6507_03775 [Prevotella bivia]|jgi:hypothetical protein|uniref:Uncharacterized protein n=2 Tax=Prevotella bivia TaxID=28125 RepID=I4Z7Y6_9BACT|nr:hypothetical protein [Prevotella bivia]EFB92505.1 hypothetical protein HMPREF0648_0317 [Prevotella bivia JCVIHMP010]EIM32328.1 hypothetical protein PrebiDRAFT_0578 [Prevotella bivia DSM 20514]KXO18437.1 hypothetical protein HMPREF3202_00095 [Prevotella bivia]KXU58681.1 hypothetical protein HMPREF3218_0200972 [Prevotella bivia]MDK7762637.1 hypothetical protein [Prevotella bivia]
MNNSKSLKRKARAEQQEKQGKKVITGIAIALLVLGIITLVVAFG